MELAKKHTDRLKDIKKKVEKATLYWKKNADRYHEFQKFVFETAISEDDESELKAYGKPILEFNITNAPISRLCGEFSKQEPSIYVHAENGVQVDPQLIEVIEGHVRHILFDAKKTNTQYQVYRDTLSGGFSDFKVWTEYAHEMSFDQVIKFGRVFEPTMAGFDPMAREVDKSDAAYCFELFPMSKEDFKRDYPDVDITDVSFVKSVTGLSWSYRGGSEDVIVLCDFYEKKKIKKKIVKLADNKVMTLDDYNKFLASWNEQGFSEQPPAVVGDPRWTDLMYVCRYRLMETEVLEYKETAFKSLPLVFVDGDSVTIKQGDNGNMTQFTKPYVYHAKGIQRLTNFSGQVIANDFESMVMHKFKVAAESLPEQEEYLEAYKDVAKASTLVYQAYFNNDPNQPNPAPMEIARVPLPPEVLNTFNTSMQMLQNILGSYDASLGINDNQLSGVAIVEAATQSNSAAMPYIVNYMQSLNRVANIIIDIMPKYYVTPRTIPIVTKEGKRDFVKINQPGGVSFNYDENSLSVQVEAGVNFQIAKNRALQQIIALMQASPIFAEFMTDEGSLEVLLDNIEFRNVDILKTKVNAWLQKRQQQAAQQPNPEMIKAQVMQQQMQLEAEKIKQKDSEIQADTMLKAQQIMLDKQKIDNERIEIMEKAGQSQDQLVVGLARAQAEESRAQTDLKIKMHDVVSKHNHNAVKLAHDILNSKKEKKEKKERKKKEKK